MDDDERNEVLVEDIVLLPVFAMRNLKETDIDSLATSIKEHGLLVPLIVRRAADPKKANCFELISGHRRFMALKKLKFRTAAARVFEVDDATAFTIAMTENLERKDPNPMDEAHAFRRAVDELKMQEKDIAKAIKRSPAYVSNRVRLLKLIPEVQKLVAEGTIPAGICEKGFLMLEHEQDQKKLLVEMKQQSQYGQGMTVRQIQESAQGIIATRKQVEALSAFLQQNKDTIKYPNCPKCHQPPAPDYHGIDLKKGTLGCRSYYTCGAWNAFKGAVTRRETTLDGEVSARSSVPGGESVVKVESELHHSALTVQQIADKLMELVVKAKAVHSLKVEEEWMGMGKADSISVSITIDPKKLKLPMLEAGPKELKTAPNATAVTLAGGNWGGNNKEVLAEREKFWALEKSIDPKVRPAAIWRQGLERLVIDHMAISKGKELHSKMGVLVVKRVHRDYTAVLLTENKTEVFVEEAELRAMVKVTKKAGK